ncbi:MAG: hypothetical protein HF962_08255 [Sulfurovum sp.]|nr:hypothetical protein [Sulfurovum sp.]
MLFNTNKYLYSGFGLYGAVDGKRGGFFTVGGDAGIQYNINKYLKFKSGLFVGAGGGGAAPQGGGLMLRPYAQVQYYTADYAIGAGVSYINFPNGDIESTQAYLSLNIPTSGAYLQGHIFGNKISLDSDNEHTELEGIEASFFTEHYRPHSGTLNTDGKTPTKPYTLAGIKFDKYISDNTYSYFQAAGAGGGDSDGYMEIFGGLGYRHQIANLPLSLGIEAAIGASGGGRVDTGGGLVYRSQLTAKADISKHLSISGFAGIIKSVDGTFSATSYGATFGYKTAIFDTISNDNKSHVTTQPFSFRMLNKSYLDTEKIFKGGTSRDVNRVDLLGCAIDWYLYDNIYLTGQTYWAYKGKAGGYAEGVFGIGYRSDSYNSFSFYTELLAGVGGGGGIDIGGGLWGSVGGGISYALNDSWELTLGVDYARNRSGSFSSSVIRFGTAYKFSMLESEE